MAAHLVAASTLADEEPELAWHHARAARARGGRIAVVRETVGLVAYRAGEWAEAIGELRAARRMGGGPGHLAILADCERALGHPERAIELSRSDQAAALDDDGRLELATVVAGARADLGQIDAALAHLEQFGQAQLTRHPRLAYAYADLLDRAGRGSEALTWFIAAANADVDEETDALERVEALATAVGDPAPGESATPDGAAGGPDGPDGTATDGAVESTAVENTAVGIKAVESTAVESTAGADRAEDDGAGSTAEPADSIEPEPEPEPAAADEPGALADPERSVENDGADVTDVTALLFSDDPQAGDR